MSVRTFLTLPFFPIPAVVSHNVTNESCLACLKSEKYVVLVTLRPLGSMRQGLESYIGMYITLSGKAKPS